MLDSRPVQLLLELSDQLLLLWAEYLLDFSETHLLILPNAPTPLDMSPVVIPQIVAARELLVAPRHLTWMRAYGTMRSPHVTTEMFGTNEALDAPSSSGAVLREKRTCVDALRGLCERISIGPLAELEHR